MTKKHFIMLAQCIREETSYTDSPDAIAAINRLANAIADVAALTNPAFDRGRFFAACKPE